MGEKGLISSQSQANVAKPQTDTAKLQPDAPNSKPDVIGPMLAGDLGIEGPAAPASLSGGNELPPSEDVVDIQGDSTPPPDETM